MLTHSVRVSLGGFGEGNSERLMRIDQVGRGERHDPRTARRPYVFGVGFHKTGTSSLAAALRALGYRTIHGDPTGEPHRGDEGRTLLEKIAREDYDLPTLHSYDAFTDNPYFSIWRPLAERHPDAKFILTVRDREGWIESCVRYYRGRRIRPMRRWMFGDHSDPSSSTAARTAWLARYDAHNEAVRAYFCGGSGRLLTMDITAGDGWGLLCPFLGTAVPAKPFPHQNVSSTRPRSSWRSWVERRLGSRFAIRGSEGADE